MKTAIAFLIFVSLGVTAALGRNPPYEGEYKTHYGSGELRSKVTYVDGNKHGIEQIFDKEGNVSQEYYYHHGERRGEVEPEVKRDFGSLRFVKSPVFWALSLASAVIIWVITSKFLLKKRPF
ncbi:MAG TPA: hypothetical protein PLT76_03155 [Candidatus Omnitrophota bacterium]|nr:hypothetical protein [Candidatus Omnitrophota bacterium]HPB67590.1 hypothetical protein [Candidatus Omnitrophota bacterium]HQO57702.1 hypothetical protein [Candidatus Omnitrophota bacterium]HQP11149.1 hypothetical protein [Candidatus Omnitrophota bacterium]